MAFEYGMLPKDVRKMTRREISALIDAMVSRKNGYKIDPEVGKVEVAVTPEFEAAVERAKKSNRFAKRAVNGK